MFFIALLFLASIHMFNRNNKKELKDEAIDETYDLIKLDTSNPDAICLDGTPAAFYFKRGASDKFLILFEGGGWCGDITV